MSEEAKPYSSDQIEAARLRPDPRAAPLGSKTYDEDDAELADWQNDQRWVATIAARDAELAALRKQVEALKASREMWRRAAYNDYVKNGTMDQPRLADAACRAAGVEVED